jgi:Ala-tRNA(Pro) deacylase
MPKGTALCNKPSSNRLTDPAGTGCGPPTLIFLPKLRQEGATFRETRMAASSNELFAFLDQLGIAHHTVSHPPLFTVEQSQQLRGAIPGGHTKNLFLKDKKGALFLVVASEDATIDLKTLHHKLGAGRLSFGSPDLLRNVLGVEPGAVTAFAAINDKTGLVAVILDKALLDHAVINCHPLVNTMTTSIARADLLKFLEATGHPPRVVAVSAAPAAAETP